MKYLFLILILFKANLSRAQEFQHNLVDRNYISKLLIHNFGPDSSQIITENILKNGNLFGGPCDIYEQIRIDKDLYKVNNSLACAKGKHEFNYPMNAKPSLLREASLNKACHELVSQKKTYNYFVKKWGPFVQLTKKEISKIAGLFHWQEPYQKDLESSLITIEKKYKNKTTKLKLIIYLSCIDPTWQII